MCVVVILQSDVHAAYVGRASYYSSWPTSSSIDQNAGSVFDRCSTADQRTSTGLDRPVLNGRPQFVANHVAGGVEGGGFHVSTPPEFHLPGSAQMALASASDAKANVSSDESFCSVDDLPPPKNSDSSPPVVDGYFPPTPMPMPLASYHSRYPPPPSFVDAGACQSFGPLPTFGGYPFPVVPPAAGASMPGLVPPPPPAYRFAVGATSRGRLQRQNGAVKSSSKMASSPRTSRSHTGSCNIIFWSRLGGCQIDMKRHRLSFFRFLVILPLQLVG